MPTYSSYPRTVGQKVSIGFVAEKAGSIAPPTTYAKGQLWPKYRKIVSGTNGSFAFPDDLSGLAGWYDASDLGLADNTAVSSFTDRSGNGRHITQATGSMQPLLRTGIMNGRPVVRFDGTDDLMASTDAAFRAQDFTVLVAFKWRSIAIAKGIMTTHETGGGFGWNLGIKGTGATNEASLISDSGLTGTYVEGGAATTNPKILALDHASSGATNLYQNGGNPAASGTVAVAYNGEPFQLGTFYRDTYPSPIDVAEICFYSRVLSTVERTSVTNYLSAKWGISVT